MQARMRVSCCRFRNTNNSLWKILDFVVRGFHHGHITDTPQERNVKPCRLLKPETATRITARCCADNRDHAEWSFFSMLMPLLKQAWYTQQCLNLVACSSSHGRFDWLQVCKVNAHKQARWQLLGGCEAVYGNCMLMHT
jgi:hypothetical protein